MSERIIKSAIGAIFLLLLPLVTSSLAEISRAIIALPSGTRFHAEIFDTPERRAQGLMFREPIASDAAALFVFDKPGRYGFWTKNCKFDMDIVWLDEKKQVVDLRVSVPPCPAMECPIYTPRVDARYVVEFLAGSVKRHRVVEGTTFRINLHAVPSRTPAADAAARRRTLPAATVLP